MTPADEPADTIIFDRPDWHRHAACRGADPDIFFPATGHLGALAHQYCAACPVQRTCLEEHLHEKFGVWGNTNAKDRRILRARRRGARR